MIPVTTSCVSATLDLSLLREPKDVFRNRAGHTDMTDKSLIPCGYRHRAAPVLE